MNKQKRITKYIYGWKLYVNYGQGWEYEIMELDRKSYLENKRLYMENCHYPQKWNYGRELNDDYIQAENAGKNIPPDSEIQLHYQ